MEIVTIMAVVVLVIAFMGILGVAVYGAIRVYKCFKNLEVQITKFNENIAIMPPLLEGVNNICESLTKSTLKMNGSVENFQKTLFSQSENGRKLVPYSDEAAAKTWDVMELMRDRGITREQAESYVGSGLTDEGTFNVL